MSCPTSDLQTQAADKPPQEVLDWVARGGTVVPISQDTWQPAIKWGKLKPATVEQVEEWARQFPGCAWGGVLARDDILVFDIDPRHGGSREALEQAIGWKLPPTYTVSPPWGGEHLYYHMPIKHPARRGSTDKLATGVGVRGREGYVILAGSTRNGVDGKWTANNAEIATLGEQ